MRAHGSRPHGKGRARARARFRLQHELGWLRGFPLGAGKGAVRWLAVPAPGTRALPSEVTVDRAWIARTSRRRNLLERDFPRVLPELVGDLDAWRAAQDAVLEPLKAWLHRGAALPATAAGLTEVIARRAAEVAAQWPELAQHLDAVGWRATDRRHADRLVRAFEQHGAALSAVAGDGVAIAMLTELLAADGRRAAVFVELLADADLDLVCDGESVERITPPLDELGRRRWPPLPWRNGVIHGQLRSWLDAVYGLDEAGRRRVYPLLAELWPQDLGQRWRAWCDVVDDLRRTVGAAVHAGDPGAAWSRREELIRALGAPPPLATAGFGERVRALIPALAADRALARDALAILRAVPVVHLGVLARLRLLCLWSALTTHPRWAGPLSDHLKRTRRHFARGDRARALAPWEPAFGARASLDALPFECGYLPLYDPSTRDERWALLAALRDGDVPLDGAIVRGAEVLFEATGSAARTMAFLVPVVAARRVNQLASLQVPALCGLCEERPGHLLAVADALAPLQPGASTWENLARLRVPARPGFLADAILAGEAARVLEVARLARAARDAVLDAGWPAADPSPAWVVRYPDALHPVLVELAAVHAGAEAIAARILRSAVPDPVRILSEVNGLESRLPGAGPAQAAKMGRRLTELRQRLAAPPRLSARRLENLARKLERRVARVVLDRLAADLRARLRRRLRRGMGPGAVSWCEAEPRVARLLPFLLDLASPHRALALRLLAARAGDPPWDLYAAPENQRFARRMRAAGVDLGPWTSGDPEAVRAGNGESLVLRLEPDPVEVFLMGEHFNTCLAPGEYNFFSTVANAADLNKQVLFARDSRGAVRGRCLLALSDEGRLLTFYPYSHDPGLQFEAVVAAFCRRLARRMGTSIAPRGTVARLLGTDWYDDGVRTLAERGDWLDVPGVLHDALPDATPGRLQELLDEHAGDTRDSAVLQRILALIEDAGREDLAFVLEPWLGSQTDPHVLVAGARALRIAGRGGAPLLRRIPMSRTLLRNLDFRVLEQIVLEFVEVDPSRALRILRWTRAPGVRTWADEYSGARLFAAGRAHEMLHRLRTALQIYELAQGVGKAGKESAARARVLRKVVDAAR